MSQAPQIKDLQERVSQLELSLIHHHQAIDALNSAIKAHTAAIAQLQVGIGTRRLVLVNEAGEFAGALQVVDGIPELRLVGHGGTATYRPPAADAAAG